MKILIACEFSGLVRQAFKAMGHDVTSCDYEDTEIPGQHYKGNVLDILHENWDIVIAFPPCDNLAASGRSSFRRKIESGEQRGSRLFFMEFTRCRAPYVAIENPVGIMSTWYRKPDQIIHPWMFGHPETKATCLWLKNLPLLRPTLIVNERGSRIHRMGNTPDRAKNRSRTYRGIANAMAIQWGKLPAPNYG